MKKVTLIVFYILITACVYGNHRTLYVDDFVNILGSPGKEDKLLLFAKKNNFKTLILYQLNKIDKKWSLSDPRKNNVLAEFIAKQKVNLAYKKLVLLENVHLFLPTE